MITKISYHKTNPLGSVIFNNQLSIHIFLTNCHINSNKITHLLNALRLEKRIFLDDFSVKMPKWTCCEVVLVHNNQTGSMMV